MRYLVTGNRGFIGSHLQNTLEKMGHNVIGLDIKDNGSILDDISKIRNLDAIFHLAALSRVRPSFLYPCEYFNTNVHGTSRVLELARQNNCRLVYAGSSSAYFDPYANPYALTKLLGEEACKLYAKAFGVSTVIARFFNVYGPGHPTDNDWGTLLGIFERLYSEGKPFTIFGGEQRRDFVHVDDIVRGLIALSERTWEDAPTFNFGSSTNYSVNEIADFFGEDYPRLFFPASKGEALTTLADISETTKLLNWKPTKDVKEYIEGYKTKVR